MWGLGASRGAPWARGRVESVWVWRPPRSPSLGAPSVQGCCPGRGRGLPWAQGVGALAVQAAALVDGEPEEGAEQHGVHLGGSGFCASSSAGSAASPGSPPSGGGRKAGTPSAQPGSPGSGPARCGAPSRAARPRPCRGGGDSAGRARSGGRGRGRTMAARPAPVRADVTCLCVLRKLPMARRQSWAEGSVRPPALPGPPCRGVDPRAPQGRGAAHPSTATQSPGNGFDASTMEPATSPRAGLSCPSRSCVRSPAPVQGAG